MTSGIDQILVLNQGCQAFNDLPIDVHQQLYELDFPHGRASFDFGYYDFVIFQNVIY